MKTSSSRSVMILLIFSWPLARRLHTQSPKANNPKASARNGYVPRGIDIDGNGVVWTALAGSGQFASFDRRKCKGPLIGPTATGQHCPEGWTLYNDPGPTFKGTDVSTEYHYGNWVDRYDRSLRIYRAFFHIACFMNVLRRVVQ
jgi:hypothetical protein